MSLLAPDQKVGGPFQLPDGSPGIISAVGRQWEPGVIRHWQELPGRELTPGDKLEQGHGVLITTALCLRGNIVVLSRKDRQETAGVDQNELPLG